MPVNAPAPKVSTQLTQLANGWEDLIKKTPDVAANIAGNVVKAGIKLVGPGVEVAAGTWATGKAGENFVKLLSGQDAPGFKGATSNTDAALGAVAYGVATMVGAGMTIHGALRAAAVIAKAVEKE